MSKSLIWTLQDSCTIKWMNKFSKSEYDIQHQPLIKLRKNIYFKGLHKEIKKYDTLIISSQFAATNITSILERKFNILSVGKKATKLLKKMGHLIIYSANNSKELASYIDNKIDAKILHPCSEKSNFSIWPKNVTSLPFYSPIPNINFNISNIKISSKTIIVFGSPSGVDVWFKNDYNLKDAKVATIGDTTAKKILSYSKRALITPKKATIDELCLTIYKHLE